MDIGNNIIERSGRTDQSPIISIPFKRMVRRGRRPFRTHGYRVGIGGIGSHLIAEGHMNQGPQEPDSQRTEKLADLFALGRRDGQGKGPVIQSRNPQHTCQERRAAGPRIVATEKGRLPEDIAVDMVAHGVHVGGKGAREVQLQQIKNQPPRHVGVQKGHERLEHRILQGYRGWLSDTAGLVPARRRRTVPSQIDSIPDVEHPGKRTVPQTSAPQELIRPGGDVGARQPLLGRIVISVGDGPARLWRRERNLRLRATPIDAGRGCGHLVRGWRPMGEGRRRRLMLGDRSEDRLDGGGKRLRRRCRGGFLCRDGPRRPSILRLPRPCNATTLSPLPSELAANVAAQTPRTRKGAVAAHAARVTGITGDAIAPPSPFRGRGSACDRGCCRGGGGGGIVGGALGARLRFPRLGRLHVRPTLASNGGLE